MSYHGLGQTQTSSQTTTQQIVVRQPYGSPYVYPGMTIPGAYPGAAYPYPIYAPGVNFYKRPETGAPGELYPMQLNPEEVEKAIYKQAPTEITQPKIAEGTEPKKIVKLKSGLEVPAYIIQRDIARKQEEQRHAEEIANIPPPKFQKIGIFATQKPLQASAAALILGYLAGQVVFALSH